MAEPKRNTIWASPNAADSNRSGLIGWDRARTSLSTLGVPGFPALLGSNLFGKMGFSTAQMAQAWLVLEMTDSDALVGMVNGLPAIPVIALALFGGVLADQGNRRQLLVLARVAMAGLGFTGGALIATESISYWHVVAIAFGVAILNVFATTVNGALLGDTVERQRLFSANALYSTASNLAVFAGPAAGGLLIGSVGIQAAYFGLVGMFIVSSVAALGVRPEQPDGDDGKPPKRVLGDLLDGFRYMAANPTLRWLILLGPIDNQLKSV